MWGQRGRESRANPRGSAATTEAIQQRHTSSRGELLDAGGVRSHEAFGVLKRGTESRTCHPVPCGTPPPPNSLPAGCF